MSRVCLSVWACLFGLAVMVGCSPKAEAPAEVEKGSAEVSATSKPAMDKLADAAAAKATSEPASLVEPFTPPALAEIDAKAEWFDQPVVNALERLTKHLAEQAPLATEEEALGLKNETREANEKILSALGRQPASPERVNMGATLNRRLSGDINSLNPVLGSSNSDFDVTGLTGVGLFSFDWTLSPFAAAESVASWQTSKDRMVDKVVLRKDLTWSDGKPVTAHDVAFSFQLIMDPRVPIYAVRSGTDELRWVHAYDDQTVVFFHKEAKATNIWNVNFPILPKHAYEASYKEDPTLVTSPHHAKLEAEPITAGPYVVASRQKRSEIVLKRRESYYMHEGKQARDKPFFDTIRFRVVEDSNTALLAIQSGDIDETVLTPEQWTKQTTGDDYYEKNTKVKAVEWVSFHVVWNMKKPFFADLRVRQAMSYAVDYEELLKRLCYDLYEPCAGMFYPGAWMAPKDYPAAYTQDLDKAENLLDAAGWQDSDGDGIRDKDGLKFEFSLIYATNPVAERYANVIKESLDKIGVLCNLRPLEFTVLQDMTSKHDFDACYGGWGTGADPSTSKNIWGTNEGRNYGGYSNPKVDELFDKATTEFDREKRGELYGQIHQLVWEDQPYTWLYWRSSFYGFNKDVRGYFMSPRGPYNYGPGSGALWRVAK